MQYVHAHALHKLSGQLLALSDGSGVPGIVKVATGDDVEMFSDPAGWEGLLDDEQLTGGRTHGAPSHEPPATRIDSRISGRRLAIHHQQPVRFVAQHRGQRA